MTAPRRSGAEQATVRGIIVLVVAAAVGFALLASTDGVVGSAGPGSANPATTTTLAVTTTLDTVVPTATSEPSTQDTRPPSEVSVIVINASGQSGVASSNNDKVAQAGYTTLEIKNGPPTSTTTIYYAPGFQADALAVQTAVGLPNAPVTEAPAEPIIPEAADADVMVVLGADYQG